MSSVISELAVLRAKSHFVREHVQAVDWRIHTIDCQDYIVVCCSLRYQVAQR